MSEELHYRPGVIGDSRPDELLDERTRFVGLCEFEALAGDFDEDDGLWGPLFEHINGGRRYERGFYRGDWCRRCGCTPHRACRESRGRGCSWVFHGLCSRCDEFPGRRRFRRHRLGPEEVLGLREHWRLFRRLYGRHDGKGT